MSSAKLAAADSLVIVGPVANEMIESLELARQSLERSIGTWDDTEGPSVREVIARIDRVLALQGRIATDMHSLA